MLARAGLPSLTLRGLLVDCWSRGVGVDTHEDDPGCRTHVAIMSADHEACLLGVLDALGSCSAINCVSPLTRNVLRFCKDMLCTSVTLVSVPVTLVREGFNARLLAKTSAAEWLINLQVTDRTLTAVTVTITTIYNMTVSATSCKSYNSRTHQQESHRRIIQ